ncbi:hypothetical protein ACR3K2_11150 [Cryptosporidium serpentis]
MNIKYKTPNLLTLLLLACFITVSRYSSQRISKYLGTPISLLRYKDNMDYYEFSENIPKDIEYNYILVGGGVSALISARSILESLNNQKINILLVERGSKYIQNNSDNKYDPLEQLSEDIITSDGFIIKQSKVEGGVTSYGSVPFIPEDPVGGNYYNSIETHWDKQRLQEAYEYVKSVGDLVQPNIQTSWVISLERAFNESRTFPIDYDRYQIYHNKLYYPTNENQILKNQEYLDQSSSHLVPHTFVTYGFRRGSSRRSATNLLNAKYLYNQGITLYKKYNFTVEEIELVEMKNKLNNNGKNSSFFAKCILGRESSSSRKIVKYCVKDTTGRIILAAGAINTPIILQKSGIGSVEMVRSANPRLQSPLIRNENIGKNLKDHPALHVFGVFRSIELPQKYLPSSDALFSSKSFGSECVRTSDKDDIFHGCEAVAISEFEGFSKMDLLHRKKINYEGNNYKDDFIQIAEQCNSLIRGVSIYATEPYSRGEVVWDAMFGKPIVHLGLLDDLRDIQTMEAAYRRILRLFRSTSITSLLLSKPVPNSNKNESLIETNLFDNSKGISNLFNFTRSENNYRNDGNKKIFHQNQMRTIYDVCSLVINNTASERKSAIMRLSETFRSEQFKNSSKLSRNSTHNTGILNRGTRFFNNSKAERQYYEPSLEDHLPLLIPSVPQHPEEMRQFVIDHITPSNHFTGTTAINLVVDPECFNVKGVRNLHILDSGILSKPTHAHPVATTMVLSRYAMVNILGSEPNCKLELQSNQGDVHHINTIERNVDANRTLYS